jgi:hypothetical protein
MSVQHRSRVEVAEKKSFALLGVGGTLVADLGLLSLGLSSGGSGSEKEYESKSHWEPRKQHSKSAVGTQHSAVSNGSSWLPPSRR